MFRMRQKYRSAGGSIPVEMVEQTLESGNVVKVQEDQSKVKLPDSELFNLEDQLKAGVMLEEVNSKSIRKTKLSVPKVEKEVAIDE